MLEQSLQSLCTIRPGAPNYNTRTQAERDFQRSARSSMDAGLFFAAARQDPQMLRNSRNEPRQPKARKNLVSTLESDGVGKRQSS